MRYSLLIILYLCIGLSAFSQSDSSGAAVRSVPADTSSGKVDSAHNAGRDSLSSMADTTRMHDTIAHEQKRQDIDLFILPGWKKPPVFMLMDVKPYSSKDMLFYILTGLVLYLALVKVVFPRYFHNLFSLVFQISFRQKQTKELMVQDSLPAFLMNLFFILCISLFITLVVSQLKIVYLSFWELLLYTSVGILSIYLVKYLFLNFAGWVFNAKAETDHYIFIVFLINKILSVVLLPLLILVCFADGQVYTVALTLSVILILLLLVYRYFLALISIRNNLTLNPFHFFIYLCAVEIIPFLLIYKILYTKTGISI